ncbi:hypothetical protein L6164_007873 [Bauhinia variegata]|uniref:Uncharacterized protein n=1 Tax=Bauhinia variegata TaxID=167791 RepID=A0ACB9PDX8_BAUVA|nr:hypothetical protein L6164_007873 [Bauhinia variegata]
MPSRSNVSTGFAILFIYLAVLARFFYHATASTPCSRQCIAENCHSVGIRYGKYCGVGYTGCPGEKPCDDLDACCQHHDDCVTNYGLTDVTCHEKLKKCLKTAEKSGNEGFSKECPYSTAAATMIHGMDLAIALSQLGDAFGSVSDINVKTQ